MGSDLTDQNFIWTKTLNSSNFVSHILIFELGDILFYLQVAISRYIKNALTI